MKYVINTRPIKVSWTIQRGSSGILEDFRRASLFVFLLGKNEARPVDYTLENNVIEATIEAGLPEGVYGLKAIWFKDKSNPFEANHIPSGACVPPMGRMSLSQVDDLFGVTELAEEDEATDDSTLHIELKSRVATYGYDGLSAYEISVISGQTSLSQSEWSANLAEMNDRMQAVETAEGNRVSSEKQRSAAETVRKQNEEARVKAEEARKADTERLEASLVLADAALPRLDALVDTIERDENDRVLAEQNRVSAEYTRAASESTRSSAETIRVSNENARIQEFNSYSAAESSRVSAEKKRVTAESGRVSAESGRVSAESKRASSESGRVTAETSRVNAETSRANAEAKRVSAEKDRVSAETVRAQNEAKRVEADKTRFTPRFYTETSNSAALEASTVTIEAKGSGKTALLKGYRTEISSGLDDIVLNPATGYKVRIGDKEVATVDLIEALAARVSALESK